MKKSAWTLAEMIIAIGILVFLTGLCVTVFKPNVQKAKICLYAAIKNINQGNIAILDKNNSLYSPNSVGENDWYCIHLVDAFNLPSSPNCSSSAAENVVNVMFPNGTTIKGLASEWKQPYEHSTFYYKNILIDIDGSGGLNKIWADQFPMRIIAGTGKGTEGLVVPVNCADDKVVDKNGTLIAVDTAAKNPYCPTPAKNYTLDDEVLTYNIYRRIDNSDNSKTRIIAASISTMEADCMAHGDSTGYFSPTECDAAKIKIKPECATKDACKTCTTNTCPEGSTDRATCETVAATSNPENLTCVAVMHKPTGGVSFIIQALVGDVTELQ